MSPLTFRKRIHLFGPFYVNIGKKSMSLTTKVGKFSHTRSTTGQRRTSVDLPGPLGYTKRSTKGARTAARRNRGTGGPSSGAGGGNVWE